MGKLILNATQVPNIILDEWIIVLNPTEFKIVMVIARQTYGWHKESDQISYSQLRFKTGQSNGAVAEALRVLRADGKIEVTNKEGLILNTKEECRGKELYYRLNITSPETGVDLSRNRTPETGDTKETNTKVLSKDNSSVAKKQPSCPLLNGSALRERYPDGHHECIEYYLSVEERRGNKFINRPKQFNCLHKILRAGYGFDEMNKVFPKIESKYGKGNWDFGTLANWLEKGAING